MARVPVRMLEAKSALAEIDLAGDASLDHPLQRPVDRRAADPRVLAPDEIDQLIGADVPFLPKKDRDDEVTLAGPSSTCRAQFLDELGRRGNRYH